MKILSFIFIIFFGFVSNVFAVTQQPILFSVQDTSSTSAIEYINIAQKSSVFVSTLNRREVPIPVGGTFKEINVRIDTAPGAGTQYDFYLIVNGTPSATLTGTISGTATEVTVTADHSITAEDKVAIGMDPTGAVTSFTRIDGNIIWEPTTDDQYLIVGGIFNGTSPGNTEYNLLENGNALNWNATEANTRQLFPSAGTFSNLVVFSAATPGGSETIDVTLRINDASPGSGPTVQLTDSDFDVLDSTNTASVAAGDTVDIQVIPSALSASTSIYWCIVFTPTTAGEIPLIGGTNNNLNTAGTEYNVIATEHTWNGTLSSRDLEIVGITITFKAQYIELNNAPGAGNTRHFDLMNDVSAEAALQVDIADTATTGNTTGQSINIDDTEKIAIRSTVTNTPAAADAYWGLVYTYGAAAPADRRIISVH